MATQSATYQAERTVTFTGPSLWDKYAPSGKTVLIAGTLLVALGWCTLVILSGISLAKKPHILPDWVSGTVILFTLAAVGGTLRGLTGRN